MSSTWPVIRARSRQDRGTGMDKCERMHLALCVWFSPQSSRLRDRLSYQRLICSQKRFGTDPCRAKSDSVAVMGQDQGLRRGVQHGLAPARGEAGHDKEKCRKCWLKTSQGVQWKAPTYSLYCCQIWSAPEAKPTTVKSQAGAPVPSCMEIWGEVAMKSRIKLTIQFAEMVASSSK